MVVPVVVDDVIADGERRPEWHARATEHPKIIQTGAAELGLCLFHNTHSWAGVMAWSQGSGGPGKTTWSKAVAMPSLIICWSSVVPNPVPPRIRTLWLTS